MKHGQMEMSFENSCIYRTLDRRARRQKRAQWWFERMRQVVERAMDWQPSPLPRPEQTWLPGSQRQVSVAPLARLSQAESACEVCE
jgi:hypothetical protein